MLDGALYVISGDSLPWLYPALELAGLCLQTRALFVYNKFLLWLGAAVVAAGAIPERDLSLLVGDLLLTLTIYIYHRK